tara:strand:- start:6504 stop:7625 length:1122 start_codon:yes stop_codon:yes gene_type:complete
MEQKYINFVVGSIDFLSYFIPIVLRANKYNIQSIFFIRKNRKDYADLFLQHNYDVLKKYSKTYNIQIKNVKEILNYPGITFLMEGDIIGNSQNDIDMSGLNYLNHTHTKVSIIYNCDFIWTYSKYLKRVDYILFPNKIYSETYNKISPRNIFLGSPKYDVSLSKSNIYRKYNLDPNKKYVILFYPKFKWRHPHEGKHSCKIYNIISPKTDITETQYFKNIYIYLKKLGYFIIVKTRNKDPVNDEILRGDKYIDSNKQYHPNPSLELLTISDLAIFFSSTTVEECIMTKTPFIDFKLDCHFKFQNRYQFLYNNNVSSLQNSLDITFEQFSKIINHLTNISTLKNRSKTFSHIISKYMFPKKDISYKILKHFSII